VWSLLYPDLLPRILGPYDVPEAKNTLTRLSLSGDRSEESNLQLIAGARLKAFCSG